MGTGWARASLLRCAFQVDELERKVKSQQDQLFLTRQELTNTSAELKMRAMQAEGGRTQACDRGAGHGSPGVGADGEPRPRGRTEEPRGGGGRGASGTRGPWGPPLRFPLGFQSAWNWRRRGPGRAWRTRSSCASKRCLHLVPPSPLSAWGLRAPQRGPATPHQPLGAGWQFSPSPRPQTQDPSCTGAVAQAAVCFLPFGLWHWDVPAKPPVAAPWKERGPQDSPASQSQDPIAGRLGSLPVSPAPTPHLGRWST